MLCTFNRLSDEMKDFPFLLSVLDDDFCSNSDGVGGVCSWRKKKGIVFVILTSQPLSNTGGRTRFIENSFLFQNRINNGRSCLSRHSTLASFPAKRNSKLLNLTLKKNAIAKLNKAQ
ncbi:hypothetical protein CEXT_730511 [Caerostris extrusa]|uniref:Uncharacterized protein n=1 Tax=Caerostris extrusa TaxID=172846 RepID=A0AAV4NFQ2_CAEEX|nr:hypothetical protein CEXT_730511 [Caerostris extrusa]